MLRNQRSKRVMAGVLLAALCLMSAATTSFAALTNAATKYHWERWYSWTDGHIVDSIDKYYDYQLIDTSLNWYWIITASGEVMHVTHNGVDCHWKWADQQLVHS